MRKLIGLFLFVCVSCFGNNNMELLIGLDKIQHKVHEVAQEINETYRGEELVVLMVMKGAMCISSELIQHLSMPSTVEHIRASSYGNNGTRAGELKITGLEGIDLTNKNVLVVDDIYDTGKTMLKILSHVEQKNPKSLKTLVLLSKDVPRETTYKPEYVLFEVPNRFIIGYGMDYKEYYRGLPGVYAFITDTP